MKKLATIILSLSLVAVLSGCAENLPAPGNTVSESSQNEITSAETAVPSETVSEQPIVRTPAKDIYVLYTNDIHCGIDDNVGYSALTAARNTLEATESDVLLADCGDFTQGGIVGVVSEGSNPIKIMNECKYNIACLGNHEFDYGLDRLNELIDEAEFPIICCNLQDNDGKPLMDGYKIFEAGGIKIAFVGILTPDTSNAESNRIQDENGARQRRFCENGNGQELYDTVQKSVDNARADGADYVIALGHLGAESKFEPWTSTDVINNTTGINAFIDGHDHRVEECNYVKNKDGANVPVSECGTKLAYFGLLKIDTDGQISMKLTDNSNVRDAVSEVEDTVAEQKQTVLATTEFPLVINEPANKDQRLVRKQETNLGDLVCDAFRVIGESDVAIINGGAIRTDIPAGEISYANVIDVLPFGNQLSVISISGQTILDVLEFGVSKLPDSEFGGFIQVSGITFDVDTSIPSPVLLDNEKAFVGCSDGQRRVSNVKIGGENLDPVKMYTACGLDYMFVSGGDGFTMFKDCEVLKSQMLLESQCVAEYIEKKLAGIIPADYSNPYGQGRINIK